MPKFNFSSYNTFFSKKHSNTSNSFAACHVVGRPVWTPRHYESLAQAGYFQNVIVFRCVNLIAKSLSNMRWLLYSKTNGAYHEIFDHPILNLLKHPNPQQGGGAFLEILFSQFLMSGNAYIEAILNEEEKVFRLITLRPDRVNVLINEEGDCVGFEYKKTKEKRIFPIDLSTGYSLILQMKTFNPLNDWYGMSPVESAARSIDQHNAVGEHNLSILQNGGRPSGALLIRSKAEGRALTEEQRESLRKDINSIYEGSKNAGKIMVLEGDCEWKEMGLSPKDLDFKAGKNISAKEIAQAFGVPPILLGMTEDATFSNYKEARLNFWEETLLPMMDHFVAELNRWLLQFFDNNLKIDYDKDHIPALTARRDHIWSMMQDASFLTINEKRAALGYGPIQDGDSLKN